MNKIVALLTILSLSGVSFGQYISEFEPNPAGQDPAEQTIEIGGGTPSAAFDLWILSVENDGYNGLVDRVNNVTGTFDANGLAVVTIPDLENPSFTLILTTSFSGDTSTDLDPTDSGTLDTSSLGEILDAIGVSDAVGDDPGLYGVLLGGSDILFNGQFEPLLVFRDSVTGELYNTVTVDFGEPTEHLGVFDSSGSGIELDAGIFDIDPLVPTFGSVNPTAASASPTWAGYTIGEEGYVQTAPWLGLLYVEEAPWVWSVGLGQYLFVDEAGVDENGGWVYFVKP
ncbi:hypothetical protein G0Q06_05015 [Puniceicoccales bacterium CK1056]|uniref:Uncharacterized protein n=1 Tax=Oceanipulchritudo coccoides TaxID=2706888 RepID=A0A6B2M121_9BACT|nr:hypothetical protein [Oceanipulchritudo coccoides]NDV61804.1 hypothetical protein [Oceanipulchritudo coccoides]